MMAVSVASSIIVIIVVTMARAVGPVWSVGPVWPVWLVGSLTAFVASQCNSIKLMDQLSS